MSTPPASTNDELSAIARVEWAALMVIVSAGLAVRLPLSRLGPTRNELQNIEVFGVGPLDLLWGFETAVNPPLWRGLFTMLFDDAFGLELARGVSILLSLVAVGLAWWLARTVSGDRMVALATALVMALHPQVVEEAVKHRAYAAWSAAALSHAILLVGALRAPADTPHRWRWASVAAVGMAWLHYYSVPLLLLWGGLLGRRWPGAWKPAAVGLVSVLPLAPRVLAGSQATVAPGSDAWTALLDLLGWTLEVRPHALLGVDAPGWWTGLGDWELVAAAFVVTPLVIAAAWRARHRDAGLQVVAWGALAAMVGVIGLGQIQALRPAAVVVLLTLGVPAVLTLPRSRAGRWVLSGLLVATMVRRQLDDHPNRMSRLARQSHPAGLVDALRPDPPTALAVVPTGAVDTVGWAWNHRRQRPGEGPDCGPRVRCVQAGPTRVTGYRRATDIPPDTAWVATFDHEDGPARCDPVRRTADGAATLWRCEGR